MNARVRELIESYKPEMIDTLCKWISTPSVQRPAQPGMPFGPELQAMLEVARTTAEQMGFQTDTCDNYLLEINSGEGERTLGILGHLDVVPVDGQNWVHAPFGAEIEAGKVYGRGTSDDKGPSLSALYALKAVREAGIPLKDKVRVLLGLNEETGSNDIAHYKLTHSMPDYGFSPDAEYPVINCEKGGLGLNLDADLEAPQAGALAVVSIKCGERVNIVPCAAEALLSGVRVEQLQARLTELEPQLALATRTPATDTTQPMYTCEQAGACVKLTAHGVASHAAMPWNGQNAAGMLLIALNMLGVNQPGISAAAMHLGMAHTGEGINLNVSDEVSGPLTCNLGIMELSAGHLRIQLDIRYPATMSSDELAPRAKRALADTPFSVSVRGDSVPLFVPEDHFVVKGLLKVYRDVTGIEGKPIAIGGGTYARSMANCVAFGNEYPGTDNHIHMPDEFVVMDEFVRNTQMIAEAIIELAGC